MDVKSSGSINRIIRNIYFYLTSFVALMMIIFSVTELINISLKTWVFTKADNYYYGSEIDCQTMVVPVSDPEPNTPSPTKAEAIESCEKENQTNAKLQQKGRFAEREPAIVRDISMIIVGIPLFWVHWRAVRNKEENL